MPLDFIPNKLRYPSLVFDGYIFLKNITNKDGSINWRCKNYWKTSELRCNVTCTTFGDDVIRPPPLQHLKDDGTLRHLPPTKKKKKIMEFVVNIKEKIPRTSQPLKHFYENCYANSLVQPSRKHPRPTKNLIQFNSQLHAHNSIIFEEGLVKYGAKTPQCYLKHLLQSIWMVNI